MGKTGRSRREEQARGMTERAKKNSHH